MSHGGDPPHALLCIRIWPVLSTVSMNAFALAGGEIRRESGFVLGSPSPVQLQAKPLIHQMIKIAICQIIKPQS